ncbi:MAG: low molecular weight phosphotyrosine protein phosphatase [Firmicutes bacterium]|nr:low molecular weight phosphotyrosine protein phosphatase [Bacillota bacterium]
MIRIMFICHGNICRSPMGEFILKDMAEKQGIGDKVFIASAATTDDETAYGGSHIYPPAKSALLAHGINSPRVNAKRAVRLRREDYAKYDLFVPMDGENVSDARDIFGGDPDGKIKLCLDFAGFHGRDVSDPWYTRDFEQAYRDIYLGCEGIIRYISKEIM